MSSPKEKQNEPSEGFHTPDLTSVRPIFDSLQDDREAPPLSKHVSYIGPIMAPTGNKLLFRHMSLNAKFLEPTEFRLDNSSLKLDNDENDDDESEDKEELAGIEQSPKLYTKLIIENDQLIKGDPFAKEYTRAADAILNLLELRKKYIFQKVDYASLERLIEYQPPSSEPMIRYAKEDKFPPKLENAELKTINGVNIVLKNGKPICHVIPVSQYLMDMTLLLNETYTRSTKSFCYKRLCLLSEKFNMHLLFNREKEFFEQKQNIHRDFYNLRKVDTVLDHMAAANVKMFVNFVKQKATDEAHTKVIVDHQTKEVLTLDEVLEKYKLKTRVITIEDLEIKAYLEIFSRFDRIAKSLIPSKKTVLGEIFLNRDNLIKGRFLAELTHELFREYREYKFQFSEMRISIYGKDKQEWDKLAGWFDTFQIYDQHVRWLIQIPRLYDMHRSEGSVKSFQELLDNIFQPLFDVTIDPQSNPKLHIFLLTVVGFDNVDEDSGYIQTSHPSAFSILPEKWTTEDNPHFCYWAYYLWANIFSLNHLRKQRGLNTFTFRPHLSESASPEHLMSAYLLAHGISRGVSLKRAPLLQYLFYLKQIGISMSPLSDNKLHLKYKDNPFPNFFARGLNVSLATDHPLLFHMTGQSLIEEYSIAAQVFDLNSCDLCELARNSVVQSGFEDVLKSYWIGDKYKLLLPEGNNDKKTNVPQARYLYRIETLANELSDLKCIAQTVHFE